MHFKIKKKGNIDKYRNKAKYMQLLIAYNVWFNSEMANRRLPSDEECKKKEHELAELALKTFKEEY